MTDVLNVDYSKLEEKGFEKVDNYYKYSKAILDGKFVLIIIIDNDNNVSSKVIDVFSNEEYLPYKISDFPGSYVFQMKEEYNRIVSGIVKNNEEVSLIKKYVKNKYGDDFEFLWEKFPNYAVVRNKVNYKWYLLLMEVDKAKLGLSLDGKVMIIDLLMDSDELLKIVDNQVFFPGYHMNKKHWVTIKLDKSVEIDAIYKMIDSSYEISLGRKK